MHGCFVKQVYSEYLYGAAMAACLLVNEFLCFLISKYGNVHTQALKKVISSFYTVHEIAVEKDLLFSQSTTDERLN